MTKPILPPSPDALDRSITALRAGQLVGVPTETVYGLAGDATAPGAVAAIFAAKGRPAFNPLIAHVASLDDARREGAFCALALRLADAFWPGPLTLVVPRSGGGRVCDLACAGLGTIALRVPGHPVMQALIRGAGVPLAAPSANRSGRPTPTLATHVAEDLADRVALVLDDGASRLGLESTVIAVRGGVATLLRPGALARRDLEAVTGAALAAPDQADRAAPPSPGMALRHYAPDAPLRTGALAARPGEVLIGFGAVEDERAFNLSPAGSDVEAASRLFALLRAADALRPAGIAVAPVPMAGLGEAINERLARAAAGGPVPEAS
jgi:L-threonylcarbamoyladenylate synthase